MIYRQLLNYPIVFFRPVKWELGFDANPGRASEAQTPEMECHAPARDIVDWAQAVEIAAQE